MTLADRILRGEFIEREHPIPLAQVVDWMESAFIFKIENVAKYIFHGTHQEHFTRADFPELRAPFPCTFFEYSVPPTSRSGDALIDQVGAAIGDLYVVDGQKAKITRFFTFDGQLMLAPVLYELELDGTDENGKLTLRNQEVSRQWGRCFGFGPLATSLFAISLLTCRNVTTTEHAPPAKLSKKHQRRGRPPLVTFHTLEIGSMTAALDRARSETGGGIKQALHVCRGHFKTFDRRPLFGKVTGRFWWQGHARGSLAEGLALKDYAVSPTEKS